MRGAYIAAAALALLAPAGVAAQAPGDAGAGNGGGGAGNGGAGGRTARYVQPYIELGQVVTADLTTDDVLTYTQVAAGIDAGISNGRAQGQVSYRYERRIDWNGDVGDQDIHSGLALAQVRLTPSLSLEGGAIATRARSDIRGAAPGNLLGNAANVSQLYSFYAGPTLSTQVGLLDVGAGYRFGYTKVEVPDVPALLPGQAPFDYFDSSRNHMATATVGVPVGRVAPFGVTVSGGWEREDADQLDQRYDGWFGRGDVVMPLSRTVAVRAGVGYEKIEVGQRDALVSAGGVPVRDADGRFVTDPASPVRIAYQTDGLIYDAGVIWRPSPRLELRANAGYRYGGETYFGSLSYAMSRDVAVNVLLYDGIETFGRQLRDGLTQLPRAFDTSIDPFGQQFGGCVFGARPGQDAGAGGGAGGCLNDVFQSIATASYRARGIDGVISASRGRTSFGFGMGYANRRLYAPRGAPGVTVIGLEDESAYAQLFWSRALSRVSNLDANVFGNWYSSGLPGAGDVYGWGANTTYSRQFGRLGTLASIGVYGFDQSGIDTQWSAQALVGARYNF